MGFYTATEVPYNDVIYRLVCIFIYIYICITICLAITICVRIHTYNTGERESERERETLPTIIPLQTVLIEMRRCQA